VAVQKKKKKKSETKAAEQTRVLMSFNGRPHDWAEMQSHK